MAMLLGVRHIVKPDLSKYSYFSGPIENFSLLPIQGFCNENYSFMMDEKKYLLRKFKDQSIDRAVEFKVQNLAYEKNIAAKALILDKENGLMICEYLDGHHKDVLTRSDLKNIANVLKKLHSITFESTPLDLEDQFKEMSKDDIQAFETLKQYPVQYRLCHNDLNPKNILFLDDVKLIDWEYAACNDRYFDLAAVSVEFKLSIQDENYFLENYFVSEKVFYIEKLNAYKTIYSTLCKQWFEEQGIK